MKKLFAMISAFVLSAVLFACSTITTESSTTNGQTTMNSTTVSPTTGNGATVATTTVKKPTKKTVIRYCGWNLGTEEENNILRRLVEKFNKESSTIRIDLIQPEGNYDEFLTTLAAAKTLPDVFLVNNVPSAVQSQWALDLTELTAADSEWNDVELGLRESVTYNGKVYGIPAAQNYIGYVVNYDLVNDYANFSAIDMEDAAAEDIFAPGQFTTDQLFEIAKSLKNINVTDGTGIIGLDSTGDMINWLPSSLDPTGQTQHFVWDGYEFNFTSDVMKDALTKIQEIASTTEQYVLSSIPDTTGDEENLVEHKKQIFGSTSASEVFNNGQMGFIQAGTWTADVEHDFNYKFIGLPDGKVISAGDFMCIGSSTKNKEAAYEVAKYLTFGLQGYRNRFQIIDENPEATNLAISGLPISTNDEVVEKWFQYVKLQGTKEVFEAVKAGEIQVLVEGNKVIPGFLDARFHYKTGIVIPGNRADSELSIGDLIWDVCSGQVSVNDYATNMTSALKNDINDVVDKAYKAMGIERER